MELEWHRHLDVLVSETAPSSPFSLISSSDQYFIVFITLITIIVICRFDMSCIRDMALLEPLVDTVNGEAIVSDHCKVRGRERGSSVRRMIQVEPRLLPIEMWR